MILHSLYLHHFRNYEEISFDFSPHFNLLTGSNAQGKTNVLEAIHYLMTGRSFRSHQSQELIQAQSHAFYIEAQFSKHGVKQTLKISFDGHERKMTLNHTPLPGISSLLGIMTGVISTPDDIVLVKGAPFERRQFLDMQIAQSDPLYVHHLSRYARAVRQRNLLLKARQGLTIESWEHEMSRSAAYIYSQRERAINGLRAHCQGVYQTLTKEMESLEIDYKNNHPSQLSLEHCQEWMVNLFRKQRTREMLLGYTLSGPHKDDLLFCVDGKDIRRYASEGQQRSYVLALRFAEWERLKNETNERPLMLVDDAGLSLDSQRQKELKGLLSTLGQVFITTTEKSFLDDIPVEKKIFQIHKGRVIQD